jgi:hypothetical protein
MCNTRVWDACESVVRKCDKKNHLVDLGLDGRII